MKRPIAIVSAGLLFALAAPLALAQSGDRPEKPAKATQPDKEKKAKKLKVGDTAPAISVEKWIKGDSVQSFEKGKIYVVEFWATWCGPCIRSMPHLSELQKKYKDSGVTIIGTNIWEDQGGQEYNAEMLAKVEKFVKDNKDMNYTVAYDGGAKAMDKAYMQASGAQGIPRAFLVNGQGKIAWMGHPMELDEQLAKIAKPKGKSDEKKPEKKGEN